MNHYEITIVVDANDADYNTNVSKISEEDLEKIKPLIAAIAAFKTYSGLSKGGYTHSHHHNYPIGKYAYRPDLGGKSPEEIYADFDAATHELFMDYCPLCEHGFHTIKSVEIAPWAKKEKLL